MSASASNGTPSAGGSTTRNPQRRPGQRPKAHCGPCNRTFPNSNALRMHRETSNAHRKSKEAIPHTQTAVVAIKASVPSASTRSTLKQPKVTDKPITCNICDREFIDKNALRMHMRSSPGHAQETHANSGRPKLHPGALRATLLDTFPPSSNHAAIPTEQVRDKRQLWCSVCNRKFLNENGFRMHVETSKEHKGNPKGSTNVTVEPGTQSAGFRDGPRRLSVDPKTIYAYPSSKIQGSMSQAITSDAMYMNQRLFDIRASTSAADATLSPSSPAMLTPKNRSTIPEAQSVATEEQYTAAKDAEDFKELWSDIPEPAQGVVLEVMRKECHSSDHLSKHGYMLREYTRADNDDYRKCKNCGGLWKAIQKSNRQKCIFHPWKRSYERRTKRKWYSSKKPYPCCQDTGKGCKTLPSHEYEPPDASVIERMGQYMLSPRHKPDRPAKRPAVVLDCEMVGVEGRQSEVVRLSAVDFLTGEILIDTYVIPTKRITDFRTRVSGVTDALLRRMILQGRAMNGWCEARAELWKHIDETTILIGQSLYHDLDVLRMVHLRVIDTAILTKNAVSKDCGRFWGLSTLYSQFIGKEIQNSSSGHDCLEDTLATREVLLWCLRYPDRLQIWATLERDLLEKGKKKREKEEKSNREGGELKCST